MDSILWGTVRVDLEMEDLQWVAYCGGLSEWIKRWKICNGQHIVGDYQGGFRDGRTVMNCILWGTIRMDLETEYLRWTAYCGGLSEWI